MLPVVPNVFTSMGGALRMDVLIGGTKLVLPGPRLDGASLYELMENEKVTVSAGVPTVWLATPAIRRTAQSKILEPDPGAIRRFGSTSHHDRQIRPSASASKCGQGLGYDGNHGGGRP